MHLVATILQIASLSFCVAINSACAQSASISVTTIPNVQPAVETTTAAETAPAPAAQTPGQTGKAPAADLSKYAIIISGISGEDLYAQQFDKWASDLRTALIDRLNFGESQVLTLTEKPGASSAKASAEEVRKALTALKDQLKPDSKVFLFFIGHGAFDGKISKFNLLGPDLTADDYAALLKPLPTRNIIIINTASASGDFIKPLAAPGRIVITATRSGMEQNATKFAEYFIAALSGKRPVVAAPKKAAPNRMTVQMSPQPQPAAPPPDNNTNNNLEADTDKNSRVSVLEAFEYATKLVADFYKTENRLATEHALLDDNGDGKGHEKPEEGDGGFARSVFFDSLPLMQAGGDPELAKLVTDKLRMEGEIEQLKLRKSQMKEEEYETELERMLVELAQTGQKIRARQNNK